MLCDHVRTLHVPHSTFPRSTFARSTFHVARCTFPRSHVLRSTFHIPRSTFARSLCHPRCQRMGNEETNAVALRAPVSPPSRACARVPTLHVCTFPRSTFHVCTFHVRTLHVARSHVRTLARPLRSGRMCTGCVDYSASKGAMAARDYQRETSRVKTFPYSTSHLPRSHAGKTLEVWTHVYRLRRLFRRQGGNGSTRLPT